MGTDRIVLGKDCIYSADPAKTGINKNVVVVGGAGSGKTVSIVEPNLIETLKSKNPDNLIVICTKRRIADKYIPEFKSKGFTVYDLNFSNPEAGNCTYDPLFYVNNEEDITELSKAIVMANERKEHSNADPFWDDSSIALLGAEIGLVLITQKEPSFADVLDTHYNLKFEEVGSGIETSLDAAFNRIEYVTPDCYAVNLWKTFCEAAPKTAKSIYVSMNSTLSAFTRDIRNCIKTKRKINFDRFAKEKSIIFITTSPVKKSLHSLANMFVAQAVSELFNIAETQAFGMLERPTTIVFDDFATGAKVADMPEKISICREKGISFLLLLQSESQLEKMYNRWGSIEILDNCDSYVFMGGNNYETARSVSLKLNAPIEEVLYLPTNKEIIFRRGSRPIITNRYNIMQDEWYQKITQEYEKRILLRER